MVNSICFLLNITWNDHEFYVAELLCFLRFSKYVYLDDVSFMAETASLLCDENYSVIFFVF